VPVADVHVADTSKCSGIRGCSSGRTTRFGRSSTSSARGNLDPKNERLTAPIEYGSCVLGRRRQIGRIPCRGDGLSHAWQGTYGGDASIVGATLVIEGNAFTVAGVTPPGFFGETLQADPPDLWVPLQQEPLIAGGETSLLRQPMSSWLA
jgi:hypothetical protein